MSFNEDDIDSSVNFLLQTQSKIKHSLKAGKVVRYSLKPGIQIINKHKGIQSIFAKFEANNNDEVKSIKTVKEDFESKKLCTKVKKSVQLSKIRTLFKAPMETCDLGCQYKGNIANYQDESYDSSTNTHFNELTCESKSDIKTMKTGAYRRSLNVRQLRNYTELALATHCKAEGKSVKDETSKSIKELNEPKINSKSELNYILNSTSPIKDDSISNESPTVNYAVSCKQKTVKFYDQDNVIYISSATIPKTESIEPKSWCCFPLRRNH